jgi:hypothetical protein
MCFKDFQSGSLYPFSKKKLTIKKPEENCLTPDKNKPGICCAPILAAMKVVPQKKLTNPNAI